MTADVYFRRSNRLSLGVSVPSSSAELALSETPNEELTSFALRLALTAHLDKPREGEFDFLAEAEATFVPHRPENQKKRKKVPTPIKAVSKKDRHEEERWADQSSKRYRDCGQQSRFPSFAKSKWRDQSSPCTSPFRAAANGQKRTDAHWSSSSIEWRHCTISLRT